MILKRWWLRILLQANQQKKDTEHTYTISKGEDIILSCDREFSPAYELYTWEILNGTDIVSLDSEVSASCTVHGKNKGTATVQVTYNWGATEPDVLTGIDRTVDHSRTTTFVITVG